MGNTRAKIEGELKTLSLEGRPLIEELNKSTVNPIDFSMKYGAW
jgi:hypothetical protein